MGRLRGRLARLLKEAGKGAVVLEQRDGTRRYFSEMEVLRETFLAQCDLIQGEPPKDSSGVIAAVLGATDQSRQGYEQRFGQVVGMEARIIASAEQGGWAETYSLLADGSVEKIRYQGEEAERIRLEARQSGAPGSRGVPDLSE